MSEEPRIPDQIKKVLEKLAEAKEKAKLPKCDRCGSQLRIEDKCICIQYIVKEKKE